MTDNLPLSMWGWAFPEETLKKPVRLWQSIDAYDECYFYRCLNCKEKWSSDRKPTDWICCPYCLVKWSGEWTKKNKRLNVDNSSWRVKQNNQYPAWTVERLDRKYPESWRIVGIIDSQFAYKYTYDIGDKQYIGISGHLKFYVEYIRFKYGCNNIRIKYNDFKNPTKIVKEYS